MNEFFASIVCVKWLLIQVCTVALTELGLPPDQVLGNPRSERCRQFLSKVLH